MKKHKHFKYFIENASMEMLPHESAIRREHLKKNKNKKKNDD